MNDDFDHGAPRHSPTLPPTLTVPPLILVVDDAPGIPQLFARLLVEAGYDASIAISVLTARTSLAQGPIDQLLLDCHLPDGTGIDVYQHALTVQPHLKHRAVFMTGAVEPHLANQVAATGCPLMEKSPSTLRAIVAHVVNAFNRTMPPEPGR